MSACKHCKAPIVWARNESDTKWLRPLEVEAKVAEPSPGHVLIVLVDGEWRAVSKVRQHAYHVCPDPEPTGTIDFEDEDDEDEPPVQVPRTRAEIAAARAANEAAREAERLAAIEREAQAIEEYRTTVIARHWTSERRVAIMQNPCPNERCGAGVNEPCRPFNRKTESRWVVNVNLQPHAERTALIPEFVPIAVRRAKEAQRMRDFVPLEHEYGFMDTGLTITQVHRLGTWVRYHGTVLTSAGDAQDIG